MQINEIIKKRRKELGLTLKQVAEQLGVSESLISRYESKDVKNMGIDKIAPLAEILKCTPAYLIDVYKRQELYSYSLSFIHYFISSFTSSNVIEVFYLIAVSYTHLDVYKRQPLMLFIKLYYICH